MTRWVLTTTTAALCAVVAMSAQGTQGAQKGQGLADLRKLYDEGKYQETLTKAQPVDSAPRIVYLEGQAQQKLKRSDAARQAYQRLAARPADDPWHDIGQSAIELLAGKREAAAKTAEQAVARDGDIAEAHFQRGLALSAAGNMPEAAAALEKATTLDPTWADAHYYAGLAYSKVKRIDLMAEHFKLFLKLAPQSPQRAQVMSIMKALGG